MSRRGYYALQTGMAAMSGIMQSYNKAMARQADITRQERMEDRYQTTVATEQERYDYTKGRQQMQDDLKIWMMRSSAKEKVDRADNIRQQLKGDPIQSPVAEMMYNQAKNQYSELNKIVGVGSDEATPIGTTPKLDYAGSLATADIPSDYPVTKETSSFGGRLFGEDAGRFSKIGGGGRRITYKDKELWTETVGGEAKYWETREPYPGTGLLVKDPQKPFIIEEEGGLAPTPDTPVPEAIKIATESAEKWVGLLDNKWEAAFEDNISDIQTWSETNFIQRVIEDVEVLFPVSANEPDKPFQSDVGRAVKKAMLKVLAKARMDPLAKSSIVGYMNKHSGDLTARSLGSKDDPSGPVTIDNTQTSSHVQFIARNYVLSGLGKAFDESQIPEGVEPMDRNLFDKVFGWVPGTKKYSSRDVARLTDAKNIKKLAAMFSSDIIQEYASGVNSEKYGNLLKQDPEFMNQEVERLLGLEVIQAIDSVAGTDLGDTPTEKVVKFVSSTPTIDFYNPGGIGDLSGGRELRFGGLDRMVKPKKEGIKIKRKKGLGYFGKLKVGGELADTDAVATEYTMGVEMYGEEVEIPTLVPTLTKEELDLMVNDIIPNKKKIPDAIAKKAIAHAQKRLREEKDIFATERVFHADSDPNTIYKIGR